LLIAAQNSFGYLQSSCWNGELMGHWLNVKLASEMEEGTFDEWAVDHLDFAYQLTFGFWTLYYG